MNRRAFVGGSDIAAILGISKRKTAYQLWLEKTGQYVEEPSEEKMRVLARGKRMEPVVLDMLREETGLEITATNRRYQAPDRQFLACEIDAEAGDINIEIKTVHPFAAKDWGEQGTDEIPVWYTAQVMYGLDLTGRKECIVAALIGADDLRIHRVEFDVEAAALCRSAAVDFWEKHVLPGIAPEPKSLEDVRRMFARDTGGEIEADAPTVDRILRLKGIAEQAKTLEREADALKLEIQRVMGERGTMIDRDGRKLATWRIQTRSALDQKALGAAHPELIQQFKRVGETRVFRLT
jgi:putative phage-type endonuclease